MRLRARSFARLLNWQFKTAALLAAVCSPVSLVVNGRRDTLLTALTVGPVLFIIWLGDRLSAADAGSVLTSPLYKDVVGRALLFVGWVMLAGLLGAVVLAPLFQLLG